ncbi:hypothetical protein EXN66_Car010997 [Channa argus]|uniref:Uncharacterized protein n=1 Tax=Channa argus TaxID=215402 RepID=A0A6G1PYA7_CHAAH|nr:hypothetical protein EXN66_Car010997 [Channa argus]
MAAAAPRSRMLRRSSSFEFLPPTISRWLWNGFASTTSTILGSRESSTSSLELPPPPILDPWDFFERQRFLQHPMADEDPNREEDRESRDDEESDSSNEES